MTGESVRLIIAGIGKLAGLDRVPRPHGFRHQAITRALDLGRDLRDVAKFSPRDLPHAWASDPGSHDH